MENQLMILEKFEKGFTMPLMHFTIKTKNLIK